MITEQDLQAAIAECQGQRNPNASTCIKLAAFYTIRNELFGNPEQVREPIYSGYSYADNPSKVEYSSDSEFGQVVNGKDQTSVFQVLDELMETVQAINPRLYASVLRRLE